MGNDVVKLELSKDIIGLPLNVLSSAYAELTGRNDRIENKDMGLYRPISPSNDENYSPYGYRNSPSPGQDGVKFTPRNNYSHINNQTVTFGKFSHISQESFANSNNYQQHHPNNNYSIINSCYRNNNNTNSLDNNHNAHFSKNRVNQPSQQNNSNNSINREQRRKPLNTFYRYGSDVMIRRAHGLTHRFRSRSDIMKIDPNPPQLLNGGAYDQLSQAIWDVFTMKAQKIETYENKISLWKDLFLYIRKCLNHYALYIVGSTMTGFGLNTSDIDMCLLIKPCTEDPRLDSVHQLHHIKNYLLRYGLIIDSELILAKVPILKFREQATGFEIDLNCNNSVGIYNTHLLYCYARLDWRIRPLVVMVKLWAQANRINDAKNLTVSSYSWTLMVIHFLQCGVSPLVLPCLHTLYPERFNSDKSKITDVHEDIKSLENFRSYNTDSLAELFIDFFGYYANFDFSQYAISVRAGGRVLVEDCKQVKAPKNDPNQWRYMCIEEPFDFTNTARSVYDIAAFRHIRTVIAKTYEELLRTKMLNNVLPVAFSPETSLVM
ncbi:poly(A) RNA polymerase gld-2 homolog A-like isoform X2 [Sitophilus oryzae]|nr:poly(A) RNA polymerase gld-2 homolog A-like isoform X2 [Sitophilus oryzae]